MDFQELELQIKDLIAKDDIETAIQLLTKYFQKDDRLDDIILQSGRYYSLRKDEGKGLVDYEEVKKTLNQLRSTILSFLKSEAEERRIKEKIFDDEDEDQSEETISVFFSLGSPHTSAQVDYIEKLKEHLLKYNIDLVTLGANDWDNLDPLKPIRQKMETCFGCLSLAMERSFVKQGVYKRGSQQENTINNQSFATPWTHIEASMAYHLGLPFLILKEKDLKEEGMLDSSLFEWRIVQINPAEPLELAEYPIKSFIRMWVEEVKNFKSKAE